jgi:hypothetical protein
VPDVVGLTEADANTAINAVDNLFIDVVIYQYSDTVPAGLVLSHDPTAGTLVPTGSSIDLVVSLGPPVEPVTTVTLVPISEGEPGSASNPLSPSDEVLVEVTSDGGLVGLDCILTITSGPATIVDGMGCCDWWLGCPWDPPCFEPAIGPDGKQAEICGGVFGPPPSGIVGRFLLHCDGPGAVTVELTPGTICGGSMDENFTVPNIHGTLDIHQVSESTCWDANECAGQPHGDATCDGRVDLADLYPFKAYYGRSAPWMGNDCCADFNHDGHVSLGDLFILKAGFGTGGYSPSTGNQNCP